MTRLSCVVVLLAAILMPAIADATTLKREYLSLLETKATRHAERSLSAFVRQAWPVLEPPTRPFVSNWHIDRLCEHLEAVHTGQITRALFNVPPGFMKSLLTDVFFPVWEWGPRNRPDLRYISASYSHDLTIRDNRRGRLLIQSAWYQARWGDRFTLSDDQNAKIRYDTDKRGFRIATSVAGLGTGERADRFIVDDPHNVQERESDAKRQAALRWFTESVTTRLNDPEHSAIIVIMQRVHEADISGHILAAELGYEHVCLPMEYEPHRSSVTVLGPVDSRTEPGELAWPARMTAAVVERDKRTMGSYASAAQFQQRPAPAEGGLLKRPWWKYYDPEQLRTKEHVHGSIVLRRIVLSCDPNLRAKALNDYVSIQAWGSAGADAYLLRLDRERLSTPEIIRLLAERYTWAKAQWPFLQVAVLVENTAAGPDVIAGLRRKVPGVIPIHPEGDKVQRVSAVTPFFEAGNVFVPGAPSPDGKGCDTAATPLWVQALIDECAAFPNATYDDQVDAMSQALLRLQAPLEFTSEHFAKLQDW